MPLVKKYKTIVLLGVQNSLEYRFDFIMSLIGAIFQIAVQYYLWTKIYEFSGKTILYGYAYAQIITYTIIASIVSRFIATGFEQDVTEDINRGGLNKFIIQPINYFTYRISKFIGEKLFQLLIICVIVLLILIGLKNRMAQNFSILNYLLFIYAIFSALILNFLIFFNLSMVAFWFTELGYFFLAARLFVNIVSGGIFPLDLFRSSILKLFRYLPFYYTINFPINLISGKLGIRNIITELLIQELWILLMLVLMQIIWTRGLKRYISAGG